MGKGRPKPEDRRAYDNAWYASKPASWKLARQKQKNDRKKVLREFVDGFKAGRSCTCGEGHPACLEFHHRDAGQKELEVSQAVSDGWALEKLATEIAKCDLICSNCHRKLHYRELAERRGSGL